MSSPYSRAPHVGERHYITSDIAPQAALLIDFDNVTLGRGSDLTKELRTLLNSEIIKGKVAVQRAYADWRRYPQYIVPLSEASIDLIFAPAYGSSKKNATDIRMAIDALELVFVRPEIGTFILLTGDSDFSSVVLKLKEYGKYVIGVGIQESSSDILVQNCDEYYSYTALTGLTKTSEAERVQFDPWVLVEEAVKKMTERRDVMRSDRLKQVMREIDKGFNEAEHGFPKFSKFLAEASSRGLVKLRKMENGQYEVSAGKKKRRRGRRDDGDSSRKSRPAAEAAPTVEAVESGDPIEQAYALLREALGILSSDGRESARDSDVKRRILVLAPNFDEAELGFPKFSLFLKQAEAHGVVGLRRKEPEGYTEVTLQSTDNATEASRAAPAEEAASDERPTVSRSRGRRTRPRGRSGETDAATTTETVADASDSAESVQDDEPSESRGRGRNGRGRGGQRGRDGRGRGGRREAEASRGEVAPEAEAPPQGDSDASTTPNAPVEDTPVFGGAGYAASPETDEASYVDTHTVDEPASEPSQSPHGDDEAEQVEPTPEPQVAEESSGAPHGEAAPLDEASPARETPAPSTSRTLHPRQQSRRRGPDGPPPIFEGQGIPSLRTTEPSAPSHQSNPSSAEPTSTSQGDSSSADDDLFQGLPKDPGAIQRYLTHRYKGVGEKTAEQVVEAFGADVFKVLDRHPERVADVLAERRAEALLDAWRADKERRSGAREG